MAICLALSAIVYLNAPAPDSLRTGLALFVLIGSLWMTQALHLSVTALLVPVLAALGGLMDLRVGLASFANPIIFLFLGGFALAAALQQQGLDRALALVILRIADGRRLLAAFLLFGLSACLSMWISNTATVAMMLPLALGLLKNEDPAHPIGHSEKTFVLLGVAYSSSIGGIGTLVGSPPNAIAAAQTGISFAEWLRIGLPLVALLLPLMLLTLYLMLRPHLGGRMKLSNERMEWTRQRQVTLLIFILTALGWVAGPKFGQLIGVKADIDSLVALAAIFALVASGVITWPEIEKRTQWSVLLLFGGGLALSRVMDISGASRFLSNEFLVLVQTAPPWLLVFGLVAFVVFLTEMVSNTASAALLVPIFVGIAPAIGLPPQLLAAAIALSASCAFMLPVATPPNAIVFATGEIPQATMMRCGLVLNIVCIAIITLVALQFYR